MNICFIGGGNMASALIAGLCNQLFQPHQIHVCDVNPDTLTRLHNEFGVQTHTHPQSAIQQSQIVLLAVKPQQLHSVAQTLAPQLNNQLIISVAAGIRAEDLARWLNTRNIVRAMPNTPALIQSGITGLFALPEVSAEQKQNANNILAAVGQTLWLQDENMIDAVTAISGSGPAYVFYLIEALQQAAQELGFNPQDARQLSLATFLGASKLAVSSNEEVATLRERVTSKGGTTFQALESLRQHQVASHICSAAQAAANRSREMADEFGKQ